MKQLMHLPAIAQSAAQLPSTSGLPSLASAYYNYLQSCLTRMLLSTADPGDLMEVLEDTIARLDSCVALLPQPALERAVPACVAAVRWLLRQSQAGVAGATCLLLAAVELLARAAVKLLRIRGSGSGSASHSEGQQPPVVPALVLEAVAVCASALGAAVEREAAAADALQEDSRDSRGCDRQPACVIIVTARLSALPFRNSATPSTLLARVTKMRCRRSTCPRYLQLQRRVCGWQGGWCSCGASWRRCQARRPQGLPPRLGQRSKNAS